MFRNNLGDSSIPKEKRKTLTHTCYILTQSYIHTCTPLHTHFNTRKRHGIPDNHGRDGGVLLNTDGISWRYNTLDLRFTWDIWKQVLRNEFTIRVTPRLCTTHSYFPSVRCLQKNTTECSRELVRQIGIQRVAQKRK